MTFIKPKRKHRNSGDGFVMLYAILFTTVVLTIGLSLLSVLIEQVPITGLERESSLSFYASDSGVECALYWDVAAAQPNGAFRDPTTGNVTCNGATISCNGTSMGALLPPAITPIGGGLTEYTCSFKATFPQGNCAAVTVKKTMVIASGAVATTTIRSRGYNTACPPTASPKPWRLERGLQTTY